MALVSVIICCYNSERYLGQTIESVINQTFADWELVIVNDGSSDKTEEIVARYMNHNPNIIYHRQRNSGFAAARNKCLELAQSDYVAIIDHDDVCMPNRLDAQVRLINENPKAALFFSDSEHFLDDGTIIQRQFDSFEIHPCSMDLSSGVAAENLLQHGCFIDSETVLFRKDAATKFGGFDPRYKYAADYDFFLRMGAEYGFVCDPQVLARWRVHSLQASHTMYETTFVELIDILEKWMRKSSITSDTRKLIQLHLWYYRMRYALLQLRAGRFNQGGRRLLESVEGSKCISDICGYLARKVRFRLKKRSAMRSGSRLKIQLNRYSK